MSEDMEYQMFPTLDEQRAHTSRRFQSVNLEPILLKVKYLEKDNWDYEMDLEDTDASLQIHK